MLGYHCSHAYPHTEMDTIETLPTMLKGADKLIHECFFATGLETGLRHVLSYDLDMYEDGNLYRVLSKSSNVDDKSPWKALRDICTDKIDSDDDSDDYDDTLHIGKQVQNEAGDLVILSNNLVKLSATEAGMYDDHDDSDIIEAWTSDFRVERVKWLNEKSQEQMALIHGTVSFSPKDFEAKTDSDQVRKQCWDRHQVLQPRYHHSNPTFSRSLRHVIEVSLAFMLSNFVSTPTWSIPVSNIVLSWSVVSY